ncbi:MAG: MMPL family transporter, partial [Candidatus Binatia bacterium]
MFGWLADLAVRRARGLLACAGVVLALSGLALWYGGAFTSATTEGIESDIAQRLIEQQLAYPGESSFIILFTPRDGGTDSVRLKQALSAALAPLRADPRVRSVLAPDDAPPLVAERMVSRGHALVVVTVRDSFTAASRYYPELRAMVQSDVLAPSFTGNLAFREDLDRTNEHDLLVAEMISLPLALLVLLVVYRTLAAAAVSVGVGAVAVLAGIASITALSHVMEIAVYAVNIASLVGLGVAIDYSLFIVSRYRDELEAGANTTTAVHTTMETAGRAVVFSGLAVAIGLGSLLFFRGSFLATMGLGAAIVVAFAVLFALTFLPALLVVLGPRINAGRVPIPRLRSAEGFWHRIAGWVMRRPVLVLVPTLALVITLGIPFVRLTMAAADVRTLPHGIEARDTYEHLRELFPNQARTNIAVVVRFPTEPAYTPERVGALYDLMQRMMTLPGVVEVEGVVSSDARLNREYFEADAEMTDDWLPADARRMRAMVAGKDVALLSALSDAAPASDQARAIVQALRADRAVADGRLLVTGPTARDVDITEFTLRRAPYAIAFTVAVTFITLFILLRSVILPIKAVVMNLLSITASFGALVWIFQDGHLARLLRFEAGPLDPTVPVLLFCAVFGLSMDYEVLMLSRMREEYLRSGDNTWAVAEGLERTGRLVTSAAAIMVVVFGAFALATVVVVKALGVALSLAVALDATIIRILIVPATMRLFGAFNWWAPPPFDKANR